MIRYPISLADLEQRVDAHDGNWRGRARQKIDGFRAAGGYDKNSSSIWSDVKPVWRAIQHDKCGFCERKLPAGDIGAVEQDVEHFRPKSRATPWTDSAGVTHPPGLRGGYWWLAYHLQNYCISCKVCNSSLKGDRFPIQGAPGAPEEVPPILDAAERPLLLFPVGDHAPDPEAHIRFQGVLPTGITPEGRATVEFFLLDQRQELEASRRRTLYAIWSALQFNHAKLIQAYQADDAEDAACARAFVRLWTADRALAQQIIDIIAL